ncbi:GH12 family glycosyl hydrolase domain-containing protein [Streptacidiphilus jiangxiensis]|uniref:Ricin-type beta-trefoil lectin domain-containing protein n=1 Tax=Streptacidiphilus jiangxiensis TaxID=235985 RepID=A0A1H7JKQ6_STRJI|nr:ricin-type beta-trefoil lectin domain protein [Streptacidiphilus jiangxiensis]SEK75258.1 Ricin-type beta-trefoil lectin domain-containing protein [Streptacidiphilus jiangxiensis]
MSIRAAVGGRRAAGLAWAVCVLATLTSCGGGTTPSAHGATGWRTAASPSPSASASPVAPVSCTTPQVPFPRTTVQDGSYIIEPDQWNASGTVCLDTPGTTGFTVSKVENMVPKTAGTPGAYANVATAPGALGLPVPVTALGDATSDWSAAAHATGNYDLAYDLWYGPNASSCVPAESAELMIWLRSTDDVRPAGDPAPGTITLAGDEYRVYLAPKGSTHTVISYVRTQPTDSVRGLNLRLFTQDAVQRGYVPLSSYLCKVSAGFEIWSGGVGLTTRSFAFHGQVGLPSGRITTADEADCLESGTGSAVRLASCGQAAGPSWTLANDGTLRVGSSCLQAVAQGSAPRLLPCSGAPQQRWAAGGGRSLVSSVTDSCLAADGTSGQVVLRPCNGADQEQWALPHNDSD